GHPRRAGVSAFGVSGTNAHVILEQPPQPSPDDTDHHPDGRPETAALAAVPAVVPVVISARSPQGLRAQAGQLASWITQDDSHTTLHDLAHSLLTARTTWDHRAVVITSDHGQVTAGLQALAAGRSAPGVVTGVSPGAGRVGKSVWVFPGQGAQWVGMG